MPRVMPFAVVAGLALTGTTVLVPAARAASPDVVISQVYGGGGNSGATYTRDFIELQNRGGAAVDVSAWSVQYASASGAAWQTTPLTGSIAPGAFYLVAESAGAGGTVELPAPQVTGTIAMSASSGKVALVTSATALSCGTACSSTVKDFIGYGAANDFEGSAAPGLSNTTSALRVSGADTDVNSADFTAGAPTPRSGGAPPPPPPPAGQPCTLTPTAIPAIQGRTETSPLVGQTVTTRGVVTSAAPGLSGFFLQDPVGDGDPQTSDGVFVFLPAGNPLSAQAVMAGDDVALTATVKEFNRLTELDSLTALQTCGTLPLPTPAVYQLPEPVQGDLERVEGMLVTIPTTLTVQQSFFLGRYGQLTLGAGGRLYQPTNQDPAGSPQALARADANARALLVLDDNSSRQNPDPIPYLDADSTRRAGDTVTGLTGLIDYGPISSSSSVRDYRLEPTAAPVFVSAGRPAAPPAVGGSLRAASFNVLNYFTTLNVPGAPGSPRGANTPEEFQRQRSKIFAALSGLDADVVGLIEIENNQVALQDLVDGLNTYLGTPGRWAPVPDPARGVGSDAIKVAQIYRTDRVEPVGASSSPADQSAFDGVGRPPVGQTYRQRSDGAVVSVVVNHFKSKGSCPASGPDADQGDGQGCWNATRVTQAGALLAFVQAVQADSGDPDVLVVGDLNSYGQEDPILALERGGLVNLLERFLGDQAYSYVFDGQSGYLDHALGTPSLAAQVSGAAEWHINADEPSVLDYNTEFKPDDRYSPTPYRSSDHDPVLVGLALTPPAPAVADLSAAVSGPAVVRRGAPVTYTLRVTNAGPGAATDVVATLATAGLAGVSAEPSTGTGSIRLLGISASGTRWQLPALAAGESVTLRVTGAAAPGFLPFAIGLGSVRSATADPVAANNAGLALTLITRGGPRGV